MRINVGVPEAHVTKPVLDAALESVTRLNESLLADKSVPTAEQGIKQGIVWKPEPPGDEHFDHAGVIMRRRWGDCDDLAPWHAASLRHTGEDEDARAIVRRSGPHRWHAIVERGDGSIDDPSRWAGMGQTKGVRPASLPLMIAPGRDQVSGVYIVRPGIALRPVPRGWQARTDLPWHYRADPASKPRPTDYAMVSLHTDPVASTALTGAIEGACKLGIAGNFAHPEHIKRLCAIADTCDGVDFDQVAAVYGEEHAIAAREAVGSFFGKVKRLAKKGLRVATAPASLITKAASSVVKVVPGIGPIAAKTLNTANEVMKGNPKAVLQLAKDPALSKLVSFVPGVGPIASAGLDTANKVFKNAPAPLASPAAVAKFMADPDAFPVVDAHIDLSTLVIPARFRT
jgi:hypothetical protein